MATQASLDGIAAHGMRWRYHINLSQWTRAIGKLNDRDDEVSRDELEPLVNAIVAKVRRFAEIHRAREGMAYDLERRADELEMLSDCEISEVNHFMGELYDSFDYWRILAR